MLLIRSIRRSADTYVTLPVTIEVLRYLKAVNFTSRTLIAAHVVDLLRPDVRLDHELGVARHDLGDRFARAYHGARRRNLEIDDFAARGGRHDLARGGVFRFAQLLLDLAEARSRHFELIACHLHVLILNGFDLEIAVEQTLLCAREFRSPLFEFGRVVDHHRLYLRTRRIGAMKLVFE